MKTTKLTAILIFLLFAIALPALTYADIAGKITALQGDVDVLKPGMERAAPAALQQPVSEGDIVRTKSNGKAEITFVDESVVRLAPNSRLQITEYLMEGSKRKSGVMNLFRGKMRAVVSKSRGFLAAAFGEGEKFEVRTPTAVAGVRGTDFFVSYSMGVTGIMVKEGRVDAFNPAMPGQVVLVTEGNATFIAENKPPSPPRPANDVEMIRYTRDTDVSEKPKEEEGTITADAGTLPPAGETFGYEAPEGIAPPATNTGAVIETVVIPSSETHPEFLSNIVVPPVITVDTIAPTASITPVSASPYTTGTDLSTVNINLSSNETSTFSYSLDIVGAWTSTPSSLTFPTLGEGPHTLNVTATDTAGNTSSPASLSFDLSRYSLTGNAIETTGALTASLLTGEVAGISNQSWGGWNIGMKGTSSMPSPFTLNAGGTSSDATISNNGGYWLEVINGFTDGVSVLSGTSNLKYLSYDRLGTGIGAMTGSYYDFNMWSATDSGTYTETPLAWSGNVTPDNNTAGLYSRDTWGWLDKEGASTGLMGGAASPWAGASSVSYMGKYDVSLGIRVGPPYLWTPEINMWGSATNNWAGITTLTGAYQGFIGGVWKGDGTIDANAYSLYIDPAGNAGILKGPVAGAYYPQLKMFEANGTWTPTALTNGLDAGTATVNVVSYNYGVNITSSSFGSGGRAYVANYSDNTVSVIDTATNTVLTTINVGTNPRGVAVNPQTNMAYVANATGNTVSVIDTATNTVLTTITVGTTPFVVDVNPQTNMAYVTNAGSNNVSVIDTATNTVVATINVGLTPFGVSVNPQTNMAYVTNRLGNTVSVIDTITNTVIGTPIDVGSYPYGVSVNPQTSMAYVANGGSGTVSVIDTATNTVVATIIVGGWPNYIAVNPQTNRAYVSNEWSNSVSVIDTTTNTVLTTITVGTNPMAVAVNPQTNRAYVTNSNSNTVSVIDTTTNAVLTTIGVGSTPWGIDTATLYTTLPYGTFNGAGSITVAGNSTLSATDWRYSIAGQDWGGIEKSIIGGNYTGPTSDTTCAIAGSCDTWNLSTFVDLSSQGTIYGTQTDGTQWSNGVLKGTTYGYGADITNTPMTWISVGETVGTFDAKALTWQAVQTGVWLETKKFLAMAAAGDTTGALAALNIPFAEVGKATLTGSNINGWDVTMKDVTFFAYQTGAAPKIWATGDVSGSYSGIPSGIANLTGSIGSNTLSANFNVNTWDATNSKWMATVTNGNIPINTMNNTSPMTFEGAAAGGIDTAGPGTFSGTAAGTAK